MQRDSPGNTAGEQGVAGPRAGRLLGVVGLTVILGGVCLAFAWSTLNALGTEQVEGSRLLLAGLSIVVLLVLVGWCYRTFSALVPAGRGGQPSRDSVPAPGSLGAAPADQEEAD